MGVDYSNQSCFTLTTASLSGTELELELGIFVGLYPGQSSVEVETSGYGEANVFGPPIITAISHGPTHGT